MCIFVGASVSFIDLTYNVIENEGPAQTALVLSNEVSYTVTFEVIINNSSGVATGEYKYIIYIFTVMFIKQKRIIISCWNNNFYFKCSYSK